MAGDIPDDYKKDYFYLKDLSDKGKLLDNNSIYKKLMDRSRNLPGFKRAMERLDVKYI